MDPIREPTGLHMTIGSNTCSQTMFSKKRDYPAIFTKTLSQSSFQRISQVIILNKDSK
jgi:hypothetical protein